jgi:hypothetical protein
LDLGPRSTRSLPNVKEATHKYPCPPDLTQPFILCTDTSANALGAALLQEEASEERPIEYASRLLTKREALAIVWGINKFRGYIEETSVVVITDHQPLRWLMTLKSPTGRLARWAFQLQPYNLSIEYTPGRANALADMLSCPAMPEENVELSSALRSLEIELLCRNELEIRTE